MDGSQDTETAARRAFDNDLIRSEIVANIFYQTTALEWTDRVDLKRFALTSRSGCETALRFLWKHVTLQEINNIHRVECDPVSNLDRETISAQAYPYTCIGTIQNILEFDPVLDGPGRIVESESNNPMGSSARQWQGTE
jgi:hypothetical protein